MKTTSISWSGLIWVGLLWVNLGVSALGGAAETPPVTAVVPESTAGKSVFEANATSADWPKEVTSSEGVVFQIYQPQFETWDGFVLTGRAAVMARLAPEDAPVYGLLSLSGKTVTDQAGGRVRFDQLALVGINFPSIGEVPPGWQTALERRLPGLITAVPLAELQESLAIAAAARNPARGELRNDPPRIIFSEKPAVLIPLDGPAQWRAIDGTGLERAINTQVLLLRQGKRYLLHLWDGYIEAPGLDGPWAVVQIPPAEIARIEEQLRASGQVDLLADDASDGPGGAISLKTTPLPEIYLTTEPTELVVSSGPLQWAPVSGTGLLYAANTEASLFKDIDSQDNYLLLSGRWFAGKGTAPQWRHVPAPALPEDFAKIPDDSPQEAVKVAVTGTPQAEEAAIANSIPEVVRVAREGETLEQPPVYENDTPELAPIESTSLFYVVNSPTPVIRVSPTVWMACENGAWFVAESTRGPWRVAVSVPLEIYRIPFGSPLHYVSYVRVQRYDSTYVWFGYTPGYYGTVIGPYGTVVYGTGYYYPAYVGRTVYVSYPASYGYAFNPCWSSWSGWSFGFSVHWSGSWGRTHYRCRPPVPCWGPYRSHFYGKRPDFAAHRGHHSHPLGVPSRRVVHPRMEHLRPVSAPNRVDQPPSARYAGRWERGSRQPLSGSKPGVVTSHRREALRPQTRNGTSRTVPDGTPRIGIARPARLGQQDAGRPGGWQRPVAGEDRRRENPMTDSGAREGGRPLERRRPDTVSPGRAPNVLPRREDGPVQVGRESAPVRRERPVESRRETLPPRVSLPPSRSRDASEGFSRGRQVPSRSLSETPAPSRAAPSANRTPPPAPPRSERPAPARPTSPPSTMQKPASAPPRSDAAKSTDENRAERRRERSR